MQAGFVHTHNPWRFRNIRCTRIGSGACPEALPAYTSAESNPSTAFEVSSCELVGNRMGPSSADDNATIPSPAVHASLSASGAWAIPRAALRLRAAERVGVAGGPATAACNAVAAGVSALGPPMRTLWPNCANAAACCANAAPAAAFGESIYSAPPITRNRSRCRPKNCSRYSRPAFPASSDALDEIIRSLFESPATPRRSSSTRRRYATSDPGVPLYVWSSSTTRWKTLSGEPASHDRV